MALLKMKVLSPHLIVTEVWKLLCSCQQRYFQKCIEEMRHTASERPIQGQYLREIGQPSYFLGENRGVEGERMEGAWCNKRRLEDGKR